MKRIFQTIAIFLLPLQLLAQTPLKQGVILYNWDVKMEKPVAKRNPKLADIMSGGMNIKLKVAFQDEQFTITNGFEEKPGKADLDGMEDQRELMNLKTGVLRTETTIAGKTYYTEEPQNWKSTVRYEKGTKNIAGYTCNRAVVQVGSDIYNVWYTPEIPFGYNPMVLKFTNLKGAVLSCQIGESICTAVSVTAEDFSTADLMPNEKAQKITPKQLDGLREKQMKARSGKYKTFRVK